MGFANGLLGRAAVACINRKTARRKCDVEGRTAARGHMYRSEHCPKALIKRDCSDRYRRTAVGNGCRERYGCVGRQVAGPQSNSRSPWPGYFGL